jgi:hypothetical protein
LLLRQRADYNDGVSNTYSLQLRSPSFGILLLQPEIFVLQESSSYQLLIQAAKLTTSRHSARIPFLLQKGSIGSQKGENGKRKISEHKKRNYNPKDDVDKQRRVHQLLPHWMDTKSIEGINNSRIKNEWQAGDKKQIEGQSL